jgi:cytochrome c biogenesis protein CcmG/thiol:disulfide interchange protein DsbE
MSCVHVATDADAADPPGADAEAAPAASRRRLAPWICLAVAVVLAGLVVVFATASKPSVDDAATPLLGRPAPDVSGPTLDGGTFQLSQRRGRWVVLNFFSPSCVPCVQEHPELLAFAASQAQVTSGRIELVSLLSNYRELDDTRAFFTRNGGGWPVVAEPTGKAFVDYGVARVPETWIIDPSGIVRQRIISTVTADSLLAQVNQLRSRG